MKLNKFVFLIVFLFFLERQKRWCIGKIPICWFRPSDGQNHVFVRTCLFFLKFLTGASLRPSHGSQKYFSGGCGRPRPRNFLGLPWLGSRARAGWKFWENARTYENMILAITSLGVIRVAATVLGCEPGGWVTWHALMNLALDVFPLLNFPNRR